MQRTVGPSTRRFYSLFYQWTQICHHDVQKPIQQGRRHFVTSTALYAKARGSIAPHKTYIRDEAASKLSDLQTAPILTIDSKPSCALEPGQIVVRARKGDDSWVVLEWAITKDQKAQLLETFQTEDHKEGLLLKTENWILGRLRMNALFDGGEVCTLWLANSLPEVERARQRIAVLRTFDMGTIVQSEDREHNGKEMTVSKVEDNIYSMPVVPRSHQLDESMTMPGAILLRRRSEEHCEVEVHLSQEQFHQLEVMDMGRPSSTWLMLECTSGVTFRLFSDHFANDDDSRVQHIVSLSGSVPNVANALQTLKDFIHSPTPVGQASPQAAFASQKLLYPQRPSLTQFAEMKRKLHIVRLRAPKHVIAAIYPQFDNSVEERLEMLARHKGAARIFVDKLDTPQDSRSEHVTTIAILGSRLAISAVRGYLQFKEYNHATAEGRAPLTLAATPLEPADVASLLPTSQRTANESESPISTARIRRSGRGLIEEENSTPYEKWLRSVYGVTESTSEALSGTSQLIDGIKAVFRTLTHPVVVLTCRDPDHQGNNERQDDQLFADCRGVTVSSFTTAALSPNPVVSFNLRRDSRTLSALRSAGTFNVHVLAASPAGARVAHPFTQPHHDPSHAFSAVQLEPLVENMPPQLSSSDGAVLARLQCEVEQEHLHVVGDHVLVLAEVKAVEILDETGAATGVDALNNRSALAYSGRGYRASGESISPGSKNGKDRSQERDSVQAVRTGTDINAAAQERDAFPPLRQLGASSETPGVKSAQNLTRSSAGEIQERSDTSLEAFLRDRRKMPRTQGNNPPKHMQGVNNTLSEPLARDPHDGSVLEDNDFDRPAPDWQDTLGKGWQQKISPSPTAGAQFGRESIQYERRPHERDTPAWVESSTTRPQPEYEHVYNSFNDPYMTSPNPMPTVTDDRANSTSPRPWQGARPIRRYFSSSSRASLSPHPATTLLRRSYSASATIPRKILKQTVGEFLSLPEPGKYLPPMNALLRAQKEAHEANRWLQRSMQTGKLTPESSAQLEAIINTNERKIGKTLALRSAEELKVMLDQGKVDNRRAPWLESSVERGLAVLLEEAKDLRKQLDSRKIGLKDFEDLKKSLEKDNEILTEIATRLRDTVDEEWNDDDLDEEGSQADSDAEQNKQFDGFRGNV